MGHSVSTPKLLSLKLDLVEAPIKNDVSGRLAYRLLCCMKLSVAYDRESLPPLEHVCFIQELTILEWETLHSSLECGFSGEYKSDLPGYFGRYNVSKSSISFEFGASEERATKIELPIEAAPLLVDELAKINFEDYKD